MNHKRYLRDGTLAMENLCHPERSLAKNPEFSPCHPERSLAKSAANRQTESKDLVFNEDSMADASFRIVVRFFDEHEIEPSQTNQ